MDQHLSKEDMQAIRLFLEKDNLRKYIRKTRRKLKMLELVEQYLYSEDESEDEATIEELLRIIYALVFQILY